MSSFNSSEKLDAKTDIFFPCSVTVTETNPLTGVEYNATYVSNSRSSAQDCLNGVNAFLAGNVMQSSDFRRSPVLVME